MAFLGKLLVKWHADPLEKIFDEYEPFSFRMWSMQSNQPDPDSRYLLTNARHLSPTGGNGGTSVAAMRTSSKEIFRGRNELEIEHNGAVYRLRQTSLGKLILTK